jgi:predicted transcriptional regulator
MRVNFTPEQEAQLSQIATYSGKPDATELMHEMGLQLIESEAKFLDAVQEGIDAADRGELIDESDMDAIVEKMLRSA